MFASLVLFAQEAAKEVAKAVQEGKGDAPVPNPFTTMLPILLVFGAFWFFVLLPAQRRERASREAISKGMKKGDEVLTSSGMLGVVHTLHDDGSDVTVKFDDNCRIRMRKASIVQILKPKDGDAPASGAKA